MKPACADQRADALLRLERTRMQWVLRSARHGEPRDGAAGIDDIAASQPLNAILTEWLADEIAARLWPGECGDSDPDAVHDSDVDEVSAVDRPPLPSQLLAQVVSDWTQRHPWVSVLAGMVAGSLAMSQRRRLLRWGVSAALPWLASNAAVLALPLFAQWLMRPAAASPATQAPVDHDPDPSPSHGDGAPSPDDAGKDEHVSGPRSGAGGSPA